MTSPSDRRSLDDVAAQLFLIVGCGRSGTSLLRSMLASAPGVCIPNELGFVGTLVRRAPKRALRSLQNGDVDGLLDYVFSSWRIRESGVEREQVAHLLRSSRVLTWNDVYLAVLAVYRDARGALRIGEKSPANVYVLPALAHDFPEARFIHVVRDPRAVVASLKRAPFASNRAGALVQRWVRAMRSHEWGVGHLSRERYLTISYETLVSADVARVLHRCCDFLEVPYSTDMLQFHERLELGFADRQRAHMQSTLLPVFSDSTERWRQELSPKEIALVQHAAGTWMDDLGYAHEHAHLSNVRLWVALDNVADLIYRARRRVARS